LVSWNFDSVVIFKRLCGVRLFGVLEKIQKWEFRHLGGPYFLAGLAEIEARTGQAEDAVKIIRQLITAPAGQFVSIARLKIDPVWDPIRNDPAFQKLLSEPEPETIYK
jgi:hypothetical protein